MKLKKSPKRPKTISEVCKAPDDTFAKFLKVQAELEIRNYVKRFMRGDPNVAVFRDPNLTKPCIGDRRKSII